MFKSKSVSVKAIADIKRAMVGKCIEHGITEFYDVCDVCINAVDGIGEMTVAGYKAWQTTNTRNAKKMKNRLAIIKMRKIKTK